jgi:hypothetical protein
VFQRGFALRLSRRNSNRDVNQDSQRLILQSDIVHVGPSTPIETKWSASNARLQICHVGPSTHFPSGNPALIKSHLRTCVRNIMIAGVLKRDTWEQEVHQIWRPARGQHLKPQSNCANERALRQKRAWPQATWLKRKGSIQKDLNERAATEFRRTRRDRSGR